MISREERSFAMGQPVGRLGTVDSAQSPHVVPVCFALAGDTIYIPVDEKPKAGDPRRLKRLRNIDQNGRVCLMVDRYVEDWSQLGWVMFRGDALIEDEGRNRTVGIKLLRARYPQYRNMALEERPLIVIKVDLVTSWGVLSG
ncbi:TIGR03668 family PPOX class F420-dependent oxidoreductase [Minwuia sp.]|uniref:TIGR03668 family PPOX class F420-dependent oxidoreductase n=1 Tax=Minwuia sp. TaxID=2493630 RepID=UPI003A91FF93